MHEASSEALAFAERFPGTGEAAVAHRMQGVTHWFEGDFRNASIHLQRALDIFDPVRDRDLAYRFGQDICVPFMFYLAVALWPLGEVAQARDLQAASIRRARETDHVPTMAVAASYRTIYEMLRNDARSAEPFAEETLRLGQVHGLPLVLAYGAAYAGWARARLGDVAEGLALMRDGLHKLRENGIILATPYLYARLAEIEAEFGEKGRCADDARFRLGGKRARRPSHVRRRVHRIRGEVLRRRDRASLTPAEEAFKTAIAIAQRQGARSFELQAALSLAKLCQSTNRPLKKHNDPRPRPPSFAPTPEFAAIAERRRCWRRSPKPAAVKASAARRDALEAACGLRARHDDDQGFRRRRDEGGAHSGGGRRGTARTPQYWTLLYGRISAAMAAADVKAARAGSEAFLAEAAALGLAGHAAVTRRVIGFQKLIAGDFPGAAADLKRALAETDERREAPLKDVFGFDVVATAMGACGHAIWYLGEFDEAARLTEAALAHANESGKRLYLHANVNRLFDGLQSDRPDLALEVAEEARALAIEHDLKYWRVWGSFWADWARARLGKPGAEDFRAYFAATSEMGVKLGVSIMWGMVADIELVSGRRREALEAVDRALAIGAEHGEYEMKTWLLRLRADVLAEDDPEAAQVGYREALRLAGEQGSPVLVLLAALSLARFLKTRGRLGEACDTLSPALEGFSPTPHCPPSPRRRR